MKKNKKIKIKKRVDFFNGMVTMALILFYDRRKNDFYSF